MSGPHDDDLTLGAALRTAREGAGRTLEQVSSLTMIRTTLLRDLEADRLESSGGTVYARGHVKSIASALRVDPAPLLAAFDLLVGAPNETPVPEVAAPAAPTSIGGTAFAASAAAALRPERHGPRWGFALAGAAVLLAGITAVGYLDQPATTGSNLSIEPGPSASATVTPSASPVAAQPDLSAAKPVVTGAQLRLRMIGGASWVSISNASATLFEGILQDGQFKDFRDPQRLKVVVGFAPAVNLNCGGHDSGQAATNAKRVKTFYCTSAGLTSL